MKTNKANVLGSVGNGINDSIYSVNVTSPLDLNVKLGQLKQNDTVKILFADGKVIQSVNTSGSSLSLRNVLDPGTYRSTSAMVLTPPRARRLRIAKSST